ncbi:hypothetical protein PsYK624_081030 [Phanerochaete sordida]|uniref:Uncharacterized protein n=1 Tax=Phanerochaete sordida TaxID=48140 RepID=A0A9P3GBY1_9APHY|nr:hypothetical protein PsYK624_081030 [Phanerochaete sordida]
MDMHEISFQRAQDDQQRTFERGQQSEVSHLQARIVVLEEELERLRALQVAPPPLAAPPAPIIPIAVPLQPAATPTAGTEAEEPPSLLQRVHHDLQERIAVEPMVTLQDRIGDPDDVEMRHVVVEYHNEAATALAQHQQVADGDDMDATPPVPTADEAGDEPWKDIQIHDFLANKPASTSTATPVTTPAKIRRSAEARARRTAVDKARRRLTAVRKAYEDGRVPPDDLPRDREKLLAWFERRFRREELYGDGPSAATGVEKSHAYADKDKTPARRPSTPPAADEPVPVPVHTALPTTVQDNTAPPAAPSHASSAVPPRGTATFFHPNQPRIRGGGGSWFATAHETWKPSEYFDEDSDNGRPDPINPLDARIFPMPNPAYEPAEMSRFRRKGMDINKKVTGRADLRAPRTVHEVYQLAALALGNSNTPAKLLWYLLSEAAHKAPSEAPPMDHEGQIMSATVKFHIRAMDWTPPVVHMPTLARRGGPRRQREEGEVSLGETDDEEEDRIKRANLSWI